MTSGIAAAIKLLEHGMKVVERVFEKMLRRIVSVDEMQFGFMPERGTIDAVFILRRMLEEFGAKEKKDELCRSRWSVGVSMIAAGLR